MRSHPPLRIGAACTLVLLICSIFASSQQAPVAAPKTPPAKGHHVATLELSRPVRQWEFVDVVGMRAGLLGREDGNFEGWIYPLKLFRDFHLVFHFDRRSIPAEKFARTLIVRPESSTIVYGNDSFQVRETLFVPPKERGAAVRLEIETFVPLEIEAVFEKDFQLMWPAAIGGTYIGWNEKLHAFALGEESKKYFGLVGSPSAAAYSVESFNNDFSSANNSFRLGVTRKGKDTKLIVIAGSFKDQNDVEQTYQRLANQYSQMLGEAGDYYQKYLENTVNLSLPDPDLQKAYDWSRISVLQGLVENPFLGTGLVAGYNTSGNDARPGFAWFFGRDSLWTSFALNSAGDFTTTHTALDFLSKFQRADGRVEHEVSQSASLVRWFQDYPYGYASADATPLFIIAADDYVSSSGDVEFAREKWDNLWRAYQFMRSTYDSQGFPQNLNVGHGWIEGGPLLPVKTELYQAGLGLQAMRALAHLALLTGKKDLQRELEQEFEKKQPVLNEAFWSPEKKSFAFALGTDNKRVDVTTVLSTVPMWFNLLEAEKSESTITQLAEAEHAADWGMRIISEQQKIFDPTGYHFGSVWPLFTGWASVGEYRYHRALPAYANLRANALLALNGPLGRVPEVISGSYNTQLATNSPHQIWSSAMVISPILRGMMGLMNSNAEHRLIFAPHVPAGWKHFEISNLPACDGKADIAYVRNAALIELTIRREGKGPCTLEFSPAFSPRARVLGAEFDGRVAPFKTIMHSPDMHATVPVSLPVGESRLRIRVANDFGMSTDADLPAIGAASSNLKVISENWNQTHDRIQIQFSGIAGKNYEVLLFGSTVSSADGAQLLNTSDRDSQRLIISFPASEAQGYTHQSVTLSFPPAK
jgi:GH15 family glucan-1,4-alpha-glucosidase